MEKYLSCWIVTGKCYFVVEDESEEGALEKLSEHVKQAHQMPFTDEMREKAILAMRTAA